MAIVTKNPYESSFETLTGQAATGVKKTIKAAGDAAAVMIKDAADSLGGQTKSTSLVDEVGLQPLGQTQAKQAEEERKKVLMQTRQNLEQINQAIKKARDERLKKELEVKKVKDQETQKKKMEEKKKQEDPLWKKMLKGSMGSKEMGKNVAG